MADTVMVQILSFKLDHALSILTKAFSHPSIFWKHIRMNCISNLRLKKINPKREVLPNYFLIFSFALCVVSLGYLRVQDVRTHWLPVLLHRVRQSLPQEPRLHPQADVPHGLLRLLGKVPVPSSGCRQSEGAQRLVQQADEVPGDDHHAKLKVRFLDGLSHLNSELGSRV